jgi:GNAT superfamily N-acetyltransferase/DNA-directed RNA polymerase subunit RPC12/RpoP
MPLLDGTVSFGSGTQITVNAPAVDCPSCAATVFTESVGKVSCDDCKEQFRAKGHSKVQCPAVECDDCGEKISFIKENRSTRGPFDTYHCYNCSTDIALQTHNGIQSTEIVLYTDWLLNGRDSEEAWNSLGNAHWWTRVETDREQAAVDSLNIEAKQTHPSFNLYLSKNVNAHLCGTENYCVGYITWEERHREPELGQLYILPAFRRQGIGAEFLGAWRRDVAGSYKKFRVNNPNADMYRLLRSIGVVEITEEGVEFPGCTITGTKIDIPDEWGPDMA